MVRICADCIKAIKLKTKTCCYESNSKQYLQPITSFTIQNCMYFKSKHKTKDK